MVRTPAPASQSASFRVSDARMRYGEAVLFANLDLELATGEITCLLGESGIGKSSLLRLLAGLEPATPPTHIDGPADPPAYMAQQDLLLPWLSVLDNVGLGERLRQEAPNTDKALDLLRRVGLADHANMRPAQLSGGMRQRVALARTLMEDRTLVLMDEPFSALDAITRLRLQDLAADLLAKRTVLLVTHDPLEALRLGHRILLMAGAPATLSEFPTPSASVPRAASEPDVLASHAALLEALAAGATP